MTPVEWLLLGIVAVVVLGVAFALFDTETILELALEAAD
jgi:hypothetical protein